MFVLRVFGRRIHETYDVVCRLYGYAVCRAVKVPVLSINGGAEDPEL
jgi:hypothetical protein